MTDFLQLSDYQVSSKLERLKELRKVIGGSQIDFAKRWGVHQTSMSKLEKGKLNVGNNLAKNLYASFNVNPHWWETGEGDMFMPTGNVELRYADADDSEGVWLPYYPVPVQGGLGEMSDPEANYGQAEKIRVIIRRGENVDRNVVFDVEGDSMYPKYSRGTKIRCRIVHRGDWDYMSSGVYAITYGDSFVVKRIKDNELLSKGILTLHSDNPLVGGSTPIPIEQIRHIWKVLRIIDSPAD